MNFPDKIFIELYPQTHNGYEYEKMYTHEKGGCYYKTIEYIDNPIYGSFISLYSDGNLTYLWGGKERPLDKKWNVVNR